MNHYNPYVRWVLCCLLTGLGLSVHSVQAAGAHSCEFDRPEETAWVQQVAQIDKSLPLGTVIFQRTLKTRLIMRKMITVAEEQVNIAGLWLIEPRSPLFAFPIHGTASGGGPLNGFGLRHTTLAGEVFKESPLSIFSSSFPGSMMITHVYINQQIVNMDNSTLQGGVLNSANDTPFIIFGTLVSNCFTEWAATKLNVTVPAPVNSTCTLDTKVKDIEWPALSSREMALNGISHKRNLDIVLSKCGKGVKPNIHFASYRDLARGQLKNPVASKKDNTTIEGLSIRAKNASTGVDIRFGDPNATAGDSTASFNIGTADSENATLTQKIDFYLERTTDKLTEGEWVSNMSFIISYP